MKEFLERIEKARFTTTREVYERRKEIREVVQTFDIDTIELYKCYFFTQLCVLKNPLKEKLWEFIILENVSPFTESKLNTLYRQYEIKCKKILQYQKKKDKEKGIESENQEQKKKTIRINSVEDLFKI